MKLIPLNLDSIRIGKPLPFSIRTTNGMLLASKGFVFQTRDQVLTMATRGGTLCVDIAESPEQHRAFMGQLDVLVRKEHTIGQIATARIDAGVPTVDPRNRAEETLRSAPPDWHDMQIRATALLRDAKAPDFLTRLGRLHAELEVLSRRMPDATLFALIHFASSELEMYSATHGMLVAVVCIMAARDTLKWDAPTVETVGKAALTMNISMTELQDELAQQTSRPNESQMAVISVHAHGSAGLLERQGVTDPLWLDAVRLHHEPPSGPLEDMRPAERLARLIERADIFAARLSPRVSRTAMPAAVAMRASYLDQDQKVDEAGKALFSAIGVYPPGCFVKLASNETAIVLKRGRTGTTPKVAVVLNRQGNPIGEMAVRDTMQPTYKIANGVTHSEVKVKLALDRMLNMI